MFETISGVNYVCIGGCVQILVTKLVVKRMFGAPPMIRSSSWGQLISLQALNSSQLLFQVHITKFWLEVSG